MRRGNVGLLLPLNKLEYFSKDGSTNLPARRASRSTSVATFLGETVCLVVYFAFILYICASRSYATTTRLLGWWPLNEVLGFFLMPI